MDRTFAAVLFAGGLFVGMITLLDLGRRLGRRRQGKDEEGARAGLGAVEGAVFSLIMATTVYVILDLEFPRLGIIRIDAFDQVLVELRQSMR
jgi:hypothetical protein